MDVKGKTVVVTGVLAAVKRDEAQAGSPRGREGERLGVEEHELPGGRPGRGLEAGEGQRAGQEALIGGQPLV